MTLTGFPLIFGISSLLLASLASSTSLADTAPLSLRDVSQYALNHAPQFNSSQRQAIIADLEFRNSRAAFLPSLDLTSSHGLQRSYPQADPHEPWASSFSLGLTETLYDNGESLTKHRIASVREEISQLNLERDRDKLLLAVSASFFNLSLARKNLEIQREQHAVLRLQVDLVKNAYKQGVKTRKDYLRFQTQFNRSEIDLLGVRNNVAKAEIDLRRLIGMPQDSHESLNFALDDSPPAPARIREINLQAHRDYKIAELERRISDLNSALVKRKELPQIGLTTSATYGSSGYLFTNVPEYANDHLGWNALISLNYNLFDFGTRRRNSEISAQQAAIKANDLEGGLLDLRQEIEKLQVDLRQLADSFQLSEELLKLERTNLALITSEYRQGKVQYLDYINSLQNLSSAKSVYFASLYELRRGQLAQQYHEGTLYEAIQKGH